MNLLHKGVLTPVRQTAALAAICVFLLSGLKAFAQATLKGAGSTFAYPVYSKWFGAYQKKDPSINFEYGYVGSSEGIKAILARTVDFGATDAVLSDAQLKEDHAKNILHIPTFAGAVVVTYNLPGKVQLQLDGATIADVFLGKITKWNDARLANLNPGIPLPDLAITIVHRSDGSGTTNIFTSYLSKVSPEWRNMVGAGRTVKWPAGQAAKGNKGVVEAVKALPGAVAYAEHAAATEQGLPDAIIQNSAGKFVRADAASVASALNSAAVPDDLRFDLTNPPGEQAYPIAGATWLLLQSDSKDKLQNKKLVQFLKWALGDGDEIVQRMGCVPLPEALKARSMSLLKRLKTP